MKKSKTNRSCHSLIPFDMIVKILTWNLEQVAVLKRQGLHELLFNLDVLRTGNVIQMCNLGHLYYPEETTERENTWTLIKEIHSSYFEERHSGIFLVVA